MTLRSELIDALCKEIDIRKDYIKNDVHTIYFGGGTPSLLTGEELKKIFDALSENYDLSITEEITIEVNPDDITEDYAKMLVSLGFNRVSVGIQSFDDNELKNINRRHTSQQAINAISTLKQAGIKNISIDLIFGLPQQTLFSWEKNLQKAISLDVQHISAYSLSYEENTVLWQKLKQKEILPIDENLSLEMFKSLVKYLTDNNFEHYEISNFAKSGFRSKHNSNYWNSTSYLGIGPAAHSFDGNSRQWNIRDTKKYIQLINNGNAFFEKENLSNEEKYNDLIITSLRTCEGLKTELIAKLFGKKLHSHCLQNAQKWIEQGKMTLENGTLRLANDGIFISDTIFSDLIYI